MEESRQARLRLEQSKSTAASVLRQQVFHFDPATASSSAGGGANPISLSIGVTPSSSSSQLVPSSLGVGTNIGGGGANMNGIAAGNSIINSGNPIQNGSRPNGRQVQEQMRHGPRVGGRLTDEHTQEEMLRSYFPGWF